MLRYNFKLKPYQHQMEALELSFDKEEYALFCEMGTGKSKILIDTMSMLYDNGRIQGALIIAGSKTKYQPIYPTMYYTILLYGRLHKHKSSLKS